MAIPQTVTVTGVIAPTSVLDTYPVLDPLYGIDGLRSVSGATERNDISTLRRREGMLAYQQDNATYYKLLPSPWDGTDNDWTPLSFSGNSVFTGMTTDDTLSISFSGDGTTSNPLTANVNLSQFENAILQLTDGLFVPQTIKTGLAYGGLVTWYSGYTYEISPAGYYIDSKFYSTPSYTVANGNPIVLADPDATFNRLDVFYVGTASTVNVLSGTPSSNPSKPSVDSNQIELSFALVEVGTTAATIFSQQIYLNNTGEPNEWSATTNAPARINVDSSSVKPIIGARNVEATNSLGLDKVLFTNAGFEFLTASYTVLTFNIQPKTVLPADVYRARLRMWFGSNTSVIGNEVNLNHGSFGFNFLSTTVQTISIPLSTFGLNSASYINDLTIMNNSKGTTPLGYYIGNVRLQGVPVTEPITISDTYVTGGTFSGGTIIFKNNSGGTFNVTGITSNNAGTFVTGATYTAGTAVFTNNTGGTFSVSGFSTGSTQGLQDVIIQDNVLTQDNVIINKDKNLEISFNNTNDYAQANIEFDGSHMGGGGGSNPQLRTTIRYSGDEFSIITTQDAEDGIQWEYLRGEDNKSTLDFNTNGFDTTMQAVDVNNAPTGPQNGIYSTVGESGIWGGLLYLDILGNTPNAGDVLTTVDGDGYATWQPATGGGAYSASNALTTGATANHFEMGGAFTRDTLIGTRPDDYGSNGIYTEYGVNSSDNMVIKDAFKGALTEDTSYGTDIQRSISHQAFSAYKVNEVKDYIFSENTDGKYAENTEYGRVTYLSATTFGTYAPSWYLGGGTAGRVITISNINTAELYATWLGSATTYSETSDEVEYNLNLAGGPLTYSASTNFFYNSSGVSIPFVIISIGAQDAGMYLSIPAATFPRFTDVVRITDMSNGTNDTEIYLSDAKRAYETQGTWYSDVYGEASNGDSVEVYNQLYVDISNGNANALNWFQTYYNYDYNTSIQALSDAQESYVEIYSEAPNSSKSTISVITNESAANFRFQNEYNGNDITVNGPSDYSGSTTYNLPLYITLNGTQYTAQTTGNIDLFGGTDTNFANTDLTATGDRIHDFDGNNLTINNTNSITLSTSDGSSFVTALGGGIGFTSSTGGTVGFGTGLIGPALYINSFVPILISNDSEMTVDVPSTTIVSPELKLQGIPEETKANVLYFDEATKMVSFGIAPTGGSGSTGPDTYITGGTYSNGVATFTNSTGGTFSVSGFSEGGSGSTGPDTYITGGTYSNGTATFTNNTGGTFSVSGFSEGGSGSTGPDTYVTGGTYSNGTGTATFTNNTGGTFSVSGLSFVDVNVNNSSVYSGRLNSPSVGSAVFIGSNAGFGASGGNSSTFIGPYAGYGATNAYESNFMGSDAGYGANNAYEANFIGYRAGYNATGAIGSNFMGYRAGDTASSAVYSNFMGYYAGYGATSANHSHFVGYQAGYGATGANNAIFIGQNAGLNATTAANSNFMGVGAGSGATGAYNSNFLGYQAGRSATDAYYANFLGYQAGYAASAAHNSIFVGQGAGFGATSAYRSNFLGFWAGRGATDAYDSNFFGYHAGRGATNAIQSNFMGYYAGSGATNAPNSNFLGYQAGYAATNAYNSNFLGESAGYAANTASYSNFLGQEAGYAATFAQYANFFGQQAGKGALGAGSSNFFGFQAGSGATNAAWSNFFGYQAGFGAASVTQGNFFGLNAGYLATNAGSSNFFGQNAGNNATAASFSNFIGWNAGSGATNANNANFLGFHAGRAATGAAYSNFMGYNAGLVATFAYYSNFLGFQAGYGADNAYHSNFIGRNAGYGATASYEANFIGVGAGSGATNANNSIFIGRNAGSGGTNVSSSIFIGEDAGNNILSAGINNNSGGGTSILIGKLTSNGGFKSSIAIGSGATNTATNQFLIGTAYTQFSMRGINYTMPSAQGGVSTVLTNNGSGVLTWTNVSGGTGGSGSTNDWALLGNAGTLSGTNFVGTTDQVGLDFRVNNVKAGTLSFGAGQTTFGYAAGLVNSAVTTTAIGYSALSQITTASNNTAVGYAVLSSNLVGTGNSGLGTNALAASIGSSNTAVGYNAGLLGTYTSCVMIGTNIGSHISVGGGGSSSVAIGASVCNGAVGSNVVAIGASALGFFGGGSGSNNVAIGSQAMYSYGVGTDNVAMGYQSMYKGTAGSNNISIGAYAFGAPIHVLMGIRNTGLGAYANYYTILGEDNQGIGYRSLFYNTSGNRNIGIGKSVLEPDLRNIVDVGNQDIWTYTGWTKFSNNTYAHVTGNTTPLINPFTTSSQKFLTLTVTITGRTAGSLVRVLNSAYPAGDVTYNTNATFTITNQQFPIDPSIVETLKFVPTSDFNGTVTIAITERRSSRPSDVIMIGNSIAGYEVEESGSIVIATTNGFSRGSNTTTIGTTATTSTQLHGILNIKTFTPSGTSDTTGIQGDISWDDSYSYVKTSVGWKRSALSSF